MKNFIGVLGIFFMIVALSAMFVDAFLIVPRMTPIMIVSGISSLGCYMVYYILNNREE